MAYINQELKAKLAPSIKSVLAKHGLKGSISVRNHMVLVVTVKSGQVDFIGDYNKTNREHRVVDNMEVNQYWVDSNHTPKVAKVIREIYHAMKGTEWYDNSDVQTDYFDTAYYMDLCIGRWNQPYQLTK